MYRHGPIKRNSKADVTKCEDDYASHTTLEIPKSLSDKCFCKQQCVCAKPETGHIEKNIKK